MYNEKLENLIQTQFPEANVEVTGGEGKYQATVISPQFEGLSTLERHRMVYKAVTAEIASGELHALSITAKTE